MGGDLSHTLNKVISSDGHLKYIYGEEPNLQECFTQVFSVKKTWICCPLSDDSFMLLNTYSFNNEQKFLKGSETIDEEDLTPRVHKGLLQLKCSEFLPKKER